MKVHEEKKKAEEIVTEKVSEVYRCELCKKMPALYFLPGNQVEVICRCNNTPKIISMKEFMAKSKFNFECGCFNHDENKAIAFCSRCQKWYCLECIKYHHICHIGKKDFTLLLLEAVLERKCKRCIKDNSTNFCLECNCYFCDTCYNVHKEHKGHFNFHLNKSSGKVLFDDLKERMEKGEKQYQTLKTLKEKIIELVTKRFDEYEKSYKTYLDFIKVIMNTYTHIGKNYLDFNIYNNMDANRIILHPELETIDVNNIDANSLKCFIEGTEGVARVKRLTDFSRKDLNGETYKGRYYGEILGDKKDGFGVVYWKDEKDPLSKSKYMFKNDELNGHSISYFKSGKKFLECKYEKNQIEGYGIKCFLDGQKYEGEFNHDIFEGIGIWYYPNNKHYYEGEFKNYKFEGTGTLFNKDGSKLYEGSISENLKVKNGIFVREDGLIYEGQWLNDKMHGFGIVTNQEGKLKYKGEFKRNDFDGKGYLYFDNGPVNYYGDFKKSLKNGFGTLYTGEKNTIDFQGEFRNDNKFMQTASPK